MHHRVWPTGTADRPSPPRASGTAKQDCRTVRVAEPRSPASSLFRDRYAFAARVRAADPAAVHPLDRIGLEGARRTIVDFLAERLELRRHGRKEGPALQVDRVASGRDDYGQRDGLLRGQVEVDHADDRL